VIFVVEDFQVNRYYHQGEKRKKLGNEFNIGRRSKLTLEQSKTLINEILVRDNKHEPMDARDICDFIQNQFKIEVSNTFPYEWGKQWKEITNTEALPLETARANITVENLKKCRGVNEKDKRYPSKINF